MNKLIPFLIGFLLGLFFVKTAFAHKIVIRYTVKSGGKQISDISSKKSAPRFKTDNPRKTSTSRPLSLDLSNDKPKPVYVTSLNSDQEYVIGLIKLYFGNDWKIAYAVARAESGLRCNAVGDTGLNPSSYGVFQIRAFTTRPPVEDLLDCEKNVAYAAQMQKWQGWSPWSAYTNGSYLNFLD